MHCLIVWVEWDGLLEKDHGVHLHDLARLKSISDICTLLVEVVVVVGPQEDSTVVVADVSPVM